LKISSLNNFQKNKLLTYPKIVEDLLALDLLELTLNPMERIAQPVQYPVTPRSWESDQRQL